MGGLWGPRVRPTLHLIRSNATVNIFPEPRRESVQFVQHFKLPCKILTNFRRFTQRTDRATYRATIMYTYTPDLLHNCWSKSPSLRLLGRSWSSLFSPDNNSTTHKGHNLTHIPRRPGHSHQIRPFNRRKNFDEIIFSNQFPEVPIIMSIHQK